MALRAYDTGTGQPVNPGDTVIDFRGDAFRFSAALEPTEPGRSGKVRVAGTFGGRVLYANVFGLVVREEDDTP